MEVGNEISQKIRSAIKAKLIELGAYVDDELPDYIMVMVANKKTQKQMTDDLALFLSSNTEKFTHWLHGLLKKLQSINTEQAVGKPKPKEKHKSDKRKSRSSVSDKGSKSEAEPKGSQTEGGKQVAAKGDKSGDKAVKEPIKKETTGNAPAASSSAEITTEINIIENTDEFAEECKEIQQKEKVKSASTGKPPPTKVRRQDRPSVDAPAPAKVPSKPRTSSTSDKTKSTASKEVRKKPTSIVASVKRRYVEEDDDEEYDPQNPAVGSLASVVQGPSRKSSVPKSLQANKSLLMKAVSDAEKSVTTGKRKEPADHHASMHSDQKRPDEGRRLKTAAGLQLISRSKRKQMEEGAMRSTQEADTQPTGKQRKTSGEFKNLKFSVKNEPARISPKSKSASAGQARLAASALKKVVKDSTRTPNGEEEEESVYGPPLPDTRRVQHITVQSSGASQHVHKLTASLSADEEEDESVGDAGEGAPDIDQLLDEEDTELDLNQDLYTEPPPPQQSDQRKIATKDPRFIVTLDGVDPITYRVSSAERHHLVQTVKPTPKYQPTPVTAPEAPTPPVTKPLESPTMYSKIQPPKIKPFSINLKDTDDEEEVEEEMTSPDKTSTSFERCKFWPACANGNNCQFVHPSIPCKMFPFCKFGDKCLYIHPNCKFDAKCSRLDCPYTHATRKAGPNIAQTVIHKIVQVPVQTFRPMVPSGAPRPLSKQCRFYPNCKNMNCPFVHPKPCRYGIGCMNKSTCTFHHPPLPEKDKMKWAPVEKEPATGKKISPSKAAALVLAAVASSSSSAT